MVDIKQTLEWAKYFANIGWKVVKVNNNYAYIRKVPLFGSYVRIPRCSWPLDLKMVEEIARQNRFLLVKITPKIRSDDSQAFSINEKFLKMGFKKDFWTQTISKTLILDISKNENHLLKSFKKGTRYSINLSKRSGVKVIKSDDIGPFYQLYQETALRNDFSTATYKDINTRYSTFKEAGLAQLLIAHIDSLPIAACLILFNASEKEAVYHMAASLNTGRRLGAAYLLVWQAIILAKKLGYKKFDFDGVADERYRIAKVMAGATPFKKGFRGKEVAYIGSYLKWYNPVFKFLFNLITKIAY